VRRVRAGWPKWPRPAGAPRPGRRAALAAIAALVVAGPNGAVAAPPAPSLEQLLSFPQVAPLLADVRGGRLVWVQAVAGVRNLWISDVAPGHAAVSRPLTRFGQDGVELGEVALSRDGAVVAFVRGGSVGPGGPVNPTADPRGPRGHDVWVGDIARRRWRDLGAGELPVISPDGRRVAFLRGGTLWLAPIAGGGGPKPIVSDTLGSPTDNVFATPAPPIWSPDSARIAFVSHRVGHSLIGVYDLMARRITWLSPSFSADAAPAWSPDGRKVAFVRMAPEATPDIFPQLREGPPWSIRVADARTGVGRVVWTATPGPGSVFYPPESQGAASPLIWTADHRLVFPWERTGWVQLYALAEDGGTPAPLSPPDAEIFAASLAGDARTVLFSTNAGDLDRRHIWTTDPAGGPPRALTTGAVVDDFPVALGGGVAFLRGEGTLPPQPAILTPAAGPVLLASSAEAARLAKGLRAPRPVQVATADGLSLHGQLFQPPGGSGERGPAVLVFHGGPYNQLLLGWHTVEFTTYALCLHLASEGYTVLSVNYRGSTGQGLGFRTPTGFASDGSSEAEDVRAAATWLGAQPGVDPGRIGLWGQSYGGLMTGLGLSRYPDLFAAGVDFAGISDWRSLLAQIAPASSEAALATAQEASPIARTAAWRAPTLIVHADDDRNVPVSQSLELIAALRAVPAPIETLMLPNETHDPLLHGSWLRVFTATDAFFARWLGLHYAASGPGGAGADELDGGAKAARPGR
jgi:dipeptidyl aminopeptidase/acylaminoacyl peptidase